MEVIANNLANLATPAFKRESVQFEQYMVPMPATEGEAPGNTNVSFVLDRGVVRDISDGRLEPTSSPTDVAITGPGYFTVQTPDGERYTRNGHFKLDNSGRLVTDEGFAVQGDGGEFTIQPEDGDIHIAGDGTVSTDKTVLGKLRLVDFADERALKKAGSSLYTADGQQPQAVAKADIHQGMIERSNVEPMLEITHMIEVMRAYQASAELTRSGEDLLKQAIEKLGVTPQS